MADNVVKLKTNSVRPEDLKVKISISDGHQGRVSNKTLSWPKLCEKLSETRWDNVTLPEYLAKSIAWQDKRKNQGYFVGGHFRDGKRRIPNLQGRSVLTFDIDNCTPELLDALTFGENPFIEYEYLLYTTRKHTPERPRVRLVMPCREEITVAQYRPIVSILSERLDSKMEAVDPVSFRPAQIMYFPSTCKDAQFIHHVNDGRLIDVPKELAAWGDWTDYASLPRSPREKAGRASAEKVEDARLKRGVVGAMCRAYTITAGFQEFLSDVYEPGDESPEGGQRWSYVGGSTTNGVVIYDDDTRFTSHHGTDPCGGDHSYTIFDGVRIHKYGHLDAPPEPGEPEVQVTSLPSYKAMAEWCRTVDPIMAQLRDDNYDHDAITMDALEDEDEDAAEVELEADAVETDDDNKPIELAPEVTSNADPDWKDRIDLTEKGLYKNTLHNVILVLENDARFAGKLGYNQFLQEPVVVKRIRSKQYGHDTGKVKSKENGDFISGEIEGAIRAILESPRGEKKSGYGMQVSDRNIKDGIIQVSLSHRFHPVRAYVQACVWDGVFRIHEMLHTYWHCRNYGYHEDVGRLMMIGAVARIFEPGCKFDFVPIFEGKTGIQKSSAILELAGHARFGELSSDLSETAKIVEQMQGKWILEIGELSQFRKTEVEVLKRVFSARVDRVRLAYGRGAKDYERQCIFMGSTNQKEYLKDPTGNRRYWPIQVPPQVIDRPGITRDRDLLWAEAYYLYKEMRRQFPDKTVSLPLYLEGKSKAEAERLQESRMVGAAGDDIRGQIEAFLETPVPSSEAAAGYRGEMGEDNSDEPLTVRDTTCIKDISFYVFGKSDKENDRRLSVEISRVMSEMPGWNKGTVRRLKGSLGPQLVYVRSDGS